MIRRTTILLMLPILMGFISPSSYSKEAAMNTFTNRLAQEKSPYLLQHANNPVDWYPWGEEAFEKAAKEDKPIFLSIGYATCHWCHVMEHESFENPEIGKLLNEAFVCIKVDREERPDIDNIYMTVCQMMTGSGGWPLTIVMTPDKKPFFAATYIPPESRFGRVGMSQLVPRIADAWKNRRDEALKSADEITGILAKQNTGNPRVELDSDLLVSGYRELMNQYDSARGGFGRSPKFPTPHRLIFLLRQGEEKGVQAVEHTLKEMRKGGIFDQVGFGFHRYSTDAQWLLPHFEKMLYDQALLVMAYTEAYEKTGNVFYRQVAEEVLEYVLRDMTAPGGGFYSAEDADSEGEEGLFYIWGADELKSLLGDDYDFVAKLWNISISGNFHDEASGKQSDKNIPHLSELPDTKEAKRLSIPRMKLFEVREKRIHPLKDTKILTDWNGLMIAAFAKAGRAFNNESYIEVAIKANEFIETEMQKKGNALWHRYRDGHKAVQGQSEDYAFQIFGLLELYETTLDIRYLETALNYNGILEKSFWDEAEGGYFMTADHAEKLIIRPKEFYDGAVPSGNSIQMLNLLKLARLTGRDELEKQANETGKAYSDLISRSPSSFSQALIALQFAMGGTVEIVVVGEREDKSTQQMLKYINGIYEPGKVVLLKESKNTKQMDRLAPFTKDLKMMGGKPTVYICRNFACEKPVNSLEELKERLK